MSLALLVTVTAEQEQLKQLILSNKVADYNLHFSTGLVKERKPSPKQMYWVGKMIEQATAQTHPVVATAGQVINPPSWMPDPLIKIDVTNIVAMFENARKHLKFPKVTLLMDVNRPDSGVRFSFDRKGRNMLWANDQLSYGVTYASINLDTGVVDLRRHGHKVKSEFMKLLGDFSQKPIEMAILHGKLTGNCCFCSLPLTDERSLQCGYGDTCARHYKLPWGKQTNMTAIGDWVLNGTKMPARGQIYKASGSSLKKYIQQQNLMADIFGSPKIDAENITESDLKTLRERVETDLSPENLSCDGELSGSKIQKKEAFLTTVQSELQDLATGN